MKKLPEWINKQTVSWALYDFADQAFSVLFVTLFIPIFVTVHLGGTEAQVGLVVGGSLLFGALIVPLIGAVSDATGRRVPFLVAATLLTAIFTVLTGYMGLVGALVLAALANISHLISKNVYDAKMTELVNEKHYGSLSGFGLFVGYLGAITTLGVAYLLLSHFGWESVRGIQIAFWQAAIWYIVFTVPVVLFLRDTPKVAQIAPAMRGAFGDVVRALKRVRKNPTLSRFFISVFFYSNAMNTIVIFLGLFGRESIGLSVQQFFPAFAIMAVTSAVGCIFVGRLSDRLGPLRLLRSILVLWIFVVLAMLSLFVVTTYEYQLFLALGGLGGLIFGAVWVLNRHVIGSIASKEEVAIIFGLDALIEKSAGILGPIVFGVLATYVSYPVGLISLIGFFVVGLLLLPRS